jgi:hypothetical protein
MLGEEGGRSRRQELLYDIANFERTNFTVFAPKATFPADFQMGGAFGAAIRYTVRGIIKTSKLISKDRRARYKGYCYDLIVKDRGQTGIRCLFFKFFRGLSCFILNYFSSKRLIREHL